MRGRPIVASVLLGPLLLLAGAPPARAGVRTDSGGQVRTMADPSTGRWAPYPVAGQRAPDIVPRLVKPVAQPCRPAATRYRPPFERFRCMAFYRDNGNHGHPVLLRQGAASDFGYLHALVDHGLDEETIASVIVNNAAGIRQPNGRFLYGLRYEVGGVGIVAVEVYEQRAPHEDFVDGDGAGVITAFCVGLDRCPEGINESIP
jgi:hypothetical protein